jgi:site-specific recombinase XerC
MGRQEFSEDDFIFANLDGSLPDPHHVTKVFNQIVRKAGLKHIRLHDLRHTYATLQRKYGVPIEAISKVLGHASEIVTLTIYDHWDGESRVAAGTFDTILENISRQRDVRKMLANGEGVECRPYRSRTCDTVFSTP